MARPTTYNAPRIDTKVRLRVDHRDLLIQAQEERGLGRNKLIELALDEFFFGKGHKPRLARPNPGQSATGAASDKAGRHSPGIAQVGRGIENAEKTEPINIRPQQARTRVQPRSRRIVQ